DSPSMKENGEGYFLTLSGMKWFWGQYANESFAREPYLSPMHAKTLASLPPALVISAEYDPIRDQGELYAKKLNQAAVPATVRRFDGMIHAFFHMAGVIEQGGEAIALVGSEVAKAFAATAKAS